MKLVYEPLKVVDLKNYTYDLVSIDFGDDLSLFSKVYNYSSKSLFTIDL